MHASKECDKDELRDQPHNIIASKTDSSGLASFQQHHFTNTRKRRRTGVDGPAQETREHPNPCSNSRNRTKRKVMPWQLVYNEVPYDGSLYHPSLNIWPHSWQAHGQERLRDCIWIPDLYQCIWQRVVLSGAVMGGYPGIGNTVFLLYCLIIRSSERLETVFSWDVWLELIKQDHGQEFTALEFCVNVPQVWKGWTWCSKYSRGGVQT